MVGTREFKDEETYTSEGHTGGNTTIGGLGEVTLIPDSVIFKEDKASLL